MNKYTLILCFLIIVACPKIDPPDDKKEIELTQSSLSLSLESQWTTSLKIKATVLDTADTFTFELLRDDSTIGIYTIENTPRDTILTDGPLTPSTEYQYHAFVLDGDIRTEYSDTLSAMTMDTTSHNFTWEIDTLGEYGSYLKDVWIVNENDIWAVGALSIPDSDGYVPSYANYNAAHWDGEEWEMMKIHSGAELNAIHYFSEDDIWVCSGFPKHWDGNEWTMYHLHNMGFDGVSINTMWGTSSSNMYFVGLNGSIVHYDGSEFVKMESGTDVELIDIDGTEDGEHIFVTGFTNVDFWGNVLLEYSNSIWNILYESDHYLSNAEDYGAVLNVNVKSDTVYATMMGGLWKYNYIEKTSVYVHENKYNKGAYFHTTHIKALETNDIFLVSTRWNTAHYNGITWNYDNSVNQYWGNGNVWSQSADYNGDLFVVVGYVGNRLTALVTRGLKN